jgi:molybdopterin-binding protein
MKRFCYREQVAKVREYWMPASAGSTDCEQEHPMKFSARNQLKGKIVEVKKGATTSHVRIEVGGQVITAAITNESADELKLEKGKDAYAIIKASSVMVGVD